MEKAKDKEKEKTSTVRQSVQFAKPMLGSRQTSESTTHTTGTRYEELPQGKPPIAITVAPRPSSARIENHPSFRNEASSPEPPVPSLPLSLLDGGTDRQFQLLDHDSPRDSTVAVPGNTAQNTHFSGVVATSSVAEIESQPSVKKTRSFTRTRSTMATPTPDNRAPTPSGASGAKPRARLTKKQSQDVAPAPPEQTPFVGLTTDIPSVAFDDFIEPEKMEFSKRGSMLIGERKANELRHLRGPSRDTSSSTPIPPIRVISPEEEVMSHRVRYMYDNGVSEMPMVPEGEAVSHSEGGAHEDSRERMASSPEPQSIRVVSAMSGQGADAGAGSSFVASSLRGSVIREEHELAGGFEDWQDVEGGDVDRYGFINPRQSSHSPQLQRMTSQLQQAAETRRGSSRLGRSPSTGKSTRSAQDLKSSTQRERTIRPMSSQSSYRSVGSSSSRIRSATNRLPHNRSRRIMDEAGDMLTLPPGLADIAAARDGGQTTARQKAKEWEREGKWRKMARMTRRDGKGGGMSFSFDTRDPKLISRTWKGIPDRWRSTAWQSFLADSARRRGGQPSDMELREAFEKLQEIPSPDDMQIDTDVPRTIGAHIMFRTRYRGGQRLLFRVLHALSLFFPETGYVQGMAALAATLLCYFDEAATFAMLVRLWMLRGLDRLYSPGFGGLMTALDELDRHWMAGGAVGAKLHELGIAPTSFGTRWYLTLFNYSIPFPAQLRVWDVFFLLGDPERPYPTPVTALEWLREGGRKKPIENIPQATPAPVEDLLSDPPVAQPPIVMSKQEEKRAKKEEAERKVKEEAEKKAKAEADRKAKEEAERKARREEAEKRAKEEADRKAKEEADKKAKIEAEKKAKREEAERKVKEEADRKAKIEADKKAKKDEAERKVKEEADRKAKKEEAIKKAKRDEAERKIKKEEAEKKAKQDEKDRKAREKKEKKEKKKNKKAPLPSAAAANRPRKASTVQSKPESTTETEIGVKPEAEAEQEAEQSSTAIDANRARSPALALAAVPRSPPGSPPASPLPARALSPTFSSPGRSPSAALAPGRARSSALAPGGGAAASPTPAAALAASPPSPEPAPLPPPVAPVPEESWPLPPSAAPILPSLDPAPPAAVSRPSTEAPVPEIPERAPSRRATTPKPTEEAPVAVATEPVPTAVATAVTTEPAPTASASVPTATAAASAPSESSSTPAAAPAAAPMAAAMPVAAVPAATSSAVRPASSKKKGKGPAADSFHGGLDVLHATSAALVDATREILLDSDFENAMKTLTSWVPVQDEELLMKVAMAEYRRGRKRRGR